jgi:hypothetical protein
VTLTVSVPAVVTIAAPFVTLKVVDAVTPTFEVAVVAVGLGICARALFVAACAGTAEIKLKPIAAVVAKATFFNLKFMLSPLFVGNMGPLLEGPIFLTLTDYLLLNT